MNTKHFIRYWLIGFFCFLAAASHAQTINISEYKAVGTENSYPLFEFVPGVITVSSSSGNFDKVLIDNVSIAYNTQGYWASYNIGIFAYSDGKLHQLQLKSGASNRGICYFKVIYDKSNIVNGLYFLINDGTATIVSSIPEIEFADIPKIFIKDGISYPVTKIIDRAFEGKTKLTSITIPESILSIGNFAFNGCTSLKEVTFSDSENSIELGYHTYSTSTGKGLFADSPIETLYIGRPYSITNYHSTYPYSSVPERYGYTPFPSTIKKLTLGDKVTSIPTYFLYNGSMIETLTIPNSVISIGSEAFKDCSNLTSLTIPNSVRSIGSSAFSGTKLKTLVFNAQNCTSCGSSSAPAFPSSISKLTIGNDVTIIPPYFLGDGSQFEQLTIPNSVTSIGERAFYNNSRLKSLTIGVGVISIGTNAFSDYVRKVFWMGNTPPKGYQNVRAYVNYVSNNQYSLNSQLLYQFLSSKFTVDGTTYIPVSPSERTCNVVDCVYSADNPDIVISDKVTNKGVELSVKNINKSSFYDNDHIQSLDISNDGKIGTYAFYGCDKVSSLKASNIGDILSSAFEICKGLSSVSVANKGNIGDYAFRMCTAIKNATISNNGYIGLGCFRGCTSLQTAVITSNGDIGASAFEDCSELQTATIQNNGDIGSQAFKDCSDLQTATIQNTGDIGSQAFYNNTKLASATIGDKVTGILSEAFYNCSALTKIIIPNSVTELGYSAFQNCSALTKISIGAGVPLLPRNVLKGCSSLAALTIPNNISSVGDFAFAGCSSLSDITIEDTAIKAEGESVSSSATDYLTLGSNESAPIFAYCPLDEVYIGRKLKYQTTSSYGYSPFYRNTSLRTVEITDAETQIYDNEFYGCSNLTSLKIGNGVKTIGNWAFSGCSSLDYFSAGNQVESIGKEAFSDCTGLTKYYSYSTVPPVCGDQALDDINKWECTLYVPNESSDEYRAAPQWKDFFFIDEMEADSGINDVILDNDGVIKVFNLSGYKVSDSLDNLSPGIYIVKQGAKTYKISVK